jgi:ComEC/Rec2-related protein
MLDYLQVIKNASTPLQHFCKSLFSDQLQHVSLYQAIACGCPPDPHIYASLKTISLWHLLIVSGGHFTALAAILNKIEPIRKLNFLKNSILLFFCLWTGFQEPAFFSLVQIIFDLTQRKYRLKVSSAQSILYSGVICLLLFPTWSLSFSFLLSWICRIAILVVAPIKSIWQQGLCFYIILLPICASFGFISPQSILWNCLFGPLLSFVLFPIALIIMISPNIVGRLCDSLVNYFLDLVALFQSTPAANSFSKTPNIYTFWIYLLLIHFIFFIYQVFKRRRLSKSSNQSFDFYETSSLIK